MKKEKAVTLTVVFLSLGFLVFVLAFERYLHIREQNEIDVHAKIIAVSLWNLEPRGATEYLTLACKEHNYDRLSVTTLQGENFIDLSPQLPSALDRSLIAMKLIHATEVSAKVIFKNRSIGRITARWYCTSIYIYLYVLVVAFMATTLLWYYLRTVEANQELEARVTNRTSDLESANQELQDEILERRKAQRALSVNEERLKMAMEGSKDGLWDWNIASGEVFFSRRWLDMLGYDMGKIEWKMSAWKELIHPEDLPLMEKMLDDHLSDQSEHYQCEYRMRTEAGAWKWILDRGRIVDRDKKGAPLRLVGTHTDIHDRKRAEEQLRESELRFRSLFESMIEGSVINEVIYDEKGEPIDYLLLDVNPAYTTNTGLTREEAIGARASKLYGTGGPPYIDIFEKVARTGEPTRFETEFKPMNRHFSISVFCPIKGQFATVFEDITERKRVEEELKQYRNHLEVLVRERTKALEIAQSELMRKERLATLGQLTGTVAHELRNPLGTVRGSLFSISERLKDGDADLKRVIARAERNIVRCDGIIEELLNFTRTSKLDLRATQLDDWLSEVISDQSLPEEIELRRNLDSGIVCEIDRERLRRCIINVVDNACEAMTDKENEEGKVADGGKKRLTITTQVRENRSEICFTDTGSGIPADELEKIFEPLYSTKSFGVGLGLPTVRQILEQHGGGIEIRSKPGQGTRATLWLPHASQESGAKRLETNEHGTPD